MSKENFVPVAGNWLLYGANAACATASLHAWGEPGPLWRKQEDNVLHEVEGLGVGCPQAPLPAATQLHIHRQGRWEFGEHGRLWKCDVGLPVFNTRHLLGPAAARTSCSMVQNSKYYSATGQRGAETGRGVRNNKHLAHGPNALAEKKRAPPKHRQSLCPHTGPSRPKDATWPRRHGKVTHYRHGREGLADRLTVGLVRGGNVGGPGATHNLGTPVSIRACSPRSVHTGHGSLHVDFKVNTEA
jgi:hypothetical protein